MCNTKTRYRRLGYDGELGEGQYCGECKRWMPTGLGFVKVEVDGKGNITNKGQKTIDKFRERVAKKMRDKGK